MADDTQDIDEALAEQGDSEGNDPAAETIEFAPAEEAPTEPTAEEKLSDAEDRLLRMQAELQNVLNRTRREVSDERKYGALPVVRGLLPAIDTMDRAIEAAEKAVAESESTDPQGLTEGFKMVRDQILGVLNQNGCEPINADPGVDFDANFHEAILQQPSEEQSAGTVIMSAQTGYKLHDRVVRAAQVIVSSGPAG